jgi:hypothetical protein
VIIRRLHCNRFKRLLSELQDRSASENESKFMEAHRAKCESCRKAERANVVALDLLRASALHHEPSLSFDARVVRKARAQMMRESLQYWSPAFAGAGLACAAIVAGMVLLGRPTGPAESNLRGSEARRTWDSQRVFPSLELKETNSFLQ